MSLDVDQTVGISADSVVAHTPRIVDADGWPAGSLSAATTYRGNPSLIDQPLTALFCSNRCPGDLALKSYNLAKALRDASIPVIGGFQTPMEQECLCLLLRGEQPVVICPARGIDNMRIPRDWRPALDDGRLLILSSLSASIKRPTAALAASRNEFVATLAQSLIIIHAATGNKTEALAQDAATGGKALFTLESPSNANLIALGAKPVQPIEIDAFGEVLGFGGD